MKLRLKATLKKSAVKTASPQHIIKLKATIQKDAGIKDIGKSLLLLVSLLNGAALGANTMELQKELQNEGIPKNEIVQVVQSVDKAKDTSEKSSITQLVQKYSRGGSWNAADLEKDLASFMKEFHSDKSYGIGVAERNPLGDVMFQRVSAIEDGRAKAQNQNASGHIFFTDAARNVYVLVY